MFWNHRVELVLNMQHDIEINLSAFVYRTVS